jgi:hypothetical protein
MWGRLSTFCQLSRSKPTNTIRLFKPPGRQGAKAKKAAAVAATFAILTSFASQSRESGQGRGPFRN